MYEAFYGLDEKPFTLSPDPRYLFLSETHREVLGHLIYGIEQGEGFIAISGEVGTGKTTLCRTLLERLGNDCEVAFLFNPQLAPQELLRAINSEFGLRTHSDSPTQLTGFLNEFLVRKKSAGRRVLLIVDEAQTLSTETLEQIRLLSNLETSRSKLLQIVLLGQPELEQKLSTTELRQLRQRITVWWKLGPMSASETRAYVLHRLRIAGARHALFSDAALSAVHRVSRGVPRIINVVCDRSLLAGYSENKSQIDKRLVAQVAGEIGPSTLATARRGRRRAIAAAATLLVLGLGFFAGRYLRDAPSRGGPPGLDAPVSAAPPQLPLDFPLPPAPARAEVPKGASANAPEAEFPAVSADALALAARPPGTAPLRQGPGGVLDALLPSRSAVATTASSVDAALSAWRLGGTDTKRLYLADALIILRDRGLDTLWMDRVGLVDVQRLNLPALVQLQSDGAARWVLLRQVTDAYVELMGVVPGESVRVSRQPFLERWTGQGYVLWRDFEGLPRAFGAGQTGPGVEWLQHALGELGHLSGRPSGRFDEATRLAVEAFQRATTIPVDGIVGPRTKIRLYQALPDYVSPSLGQAAVDVAALRGTRPGSVARQASVGRTP